MRHRRELDCGSLEVLRVDPKGIGMPVEENGSTISAERLNNRSSCPYGMMTFMDWTEVLYLSPSEKAIVRQLMALKDTVGVGGDGEALAHCDKMKVKDDDLEGFPVN